jgi:hypothetical protein
MPETVLRRFWQAILKWRWLRLAVALLAVFAVVSRSSNSD